MEHGGRLFQSRPPRCVRTRLSAYRELDRRPRRRRGDPAPTEAVTVQIRLVSYRQDVRGGPRMEEPARLVNVTLNTGGVLDPALRAIRQTVDVVTFCLNAIEQGDLSSWPQTDMMRFDLQFSDEMSAERRKAAYTHWLLSKGFQDLARGMRQTLEEAYFYNGMVARAGGLRAGVE